MAFQALPPTSSFTVQKLICTLSSPGACRSLSMAGPSIQRSRATVPSFSPAPGHIATILGSTHPVFGLAMRSGRASTHAHGVGLQGISFVPNWVLLRRSATRPRSKLFPGESPFKPGGSRKEPHPWAPTTESEANAIDQAGAGGAHQSPVLFPPARSPCAHVFAGPLRSRDPLENSGQLAWPVGVWAGGEVSFIPRSIILSTAETLRCAPWRPASHKVWIPERGM